VFLQSRKKSTFVCGISAGAVLLFVLGWQWYWALTSGRAESGFQQALSAYQASDYHKATGQFSEVGSRWPRTTPGHLASL